MPCVNTSLQSVNVFKEPGKEQDTRQSDIFKNSHLILLRKFDTCLEISISVC